MSEELKVALAAVMKESQRLAELYGRGYALSKNANDRAKSIWYSAQLRLAENLHWHFTGGAEEDGEVPSAWDPKEELESIAWPYR